MGIWDAVENAKEGAGGRKYKKYQKHEKEDELNEWVEEFKERFPGGVEVDFIEVSPEMEKHHGFAYNKPDAHYIRIAEYIIGRYDDQYLRMVVIHEMVHLWLHQNGYGDLTERDPIFTWLLGRVGADLSGYSPPHDFYNIAELFMRHKKVEGLDTKTYNEFFS